MTEQPGQPTLEEVESGLRASVRSADKYLGQLRAVTQRLGDVVTTYESLAVEARVALAGAAKMLDTLETAKRAIESQADDASRLIAAKVEYSRYAAKAAEN